MKPCVYVVFSLSFQLSSRAPPPLFPSPSLPNHGIDSASLASVTKALASAPLNQSSKRAGRIDSPQGLGRAPAAWQRRVRRFPRRRRDDRLAGVGPRHHLYEGALCTLDA